MKYFLSALLLVISYLPTYGQQDSGFKITMIDTIPEYQFAISDINSDRYPPSSIFDGSLKTCWVVGNSPLYLKSGSSNNVLNIFGGYGKSKSLFDMNDRPKELLITYFIGIHPQGYVSEIAAEYYLYPLEISQKVAFLDSMYTKHIPLFNIDQEVMKNAEVRFKSEKGIPVEELTPVIKLEIVDKYPGSKYSDMCISEIYFSDKYVPYFNNTYQSIKAKEFMINKAENALMANYSNGQSKTLYQNLNEIVWLGEVSQDKNWLTVLTMHSEDQGMGLTNYLLIHTLTGRIVNTELEHTLGNRISQIFLIEKDNKTFVECVTTDGKEYILAVYY